VTGHPETRWARAGTANRGYGETFDRLVAAGEDVDGEARLADALVGRGARILDVGSGMGRVSAALAARGHDVVPVEPDPALVEQSGRTYPQLPVVHDDILGVDAGRLADLGRPTDFDLAVLVGNVMVFVAEGTERLVLRRVRDLLAPQGRVLVGFHPVDGPMAARPYPVADFSADAAASGLRVDLVVGSYELRPPAGDYAVIVLARDDAS
jgi:SAM-dependent methyltransferase